VNVRDGAVAGGAGGLLVRTVRVADDRPLLDLIAADGSTPTVYVRSGEGFVATGVTVQLEVPTGRDRLRAVDAALEGFAHTAEVVDQVGLPGSSGLAIGSFTFDQDRPGSVLIVPREIVGRRHGTTWRTTITSAASERPAGAPAPELLTWRADHTGHAATTSGTTRPVHGTGPGTSRSRPRFAGSSLKDEDWLAAVAAAVQRIDDGALEKVVLARDRRLWARAPFDVHGVLHALAVRFPSCTTFHVEGLVGASPELLLAREAGTARSEVLAGTAARGTDPQEDAALGAALLSSAKDHGEHELAAMSARLAFASLGLAVTCDGPSLLRLDNVQHLASRLVARAAQVGAEDGRVDAFPRALTLVQALHPTAAVGGWPRDVALDLIAELEGLDRGRYAGPVGWTSFDGDGDWSIALRCAEIDGDRARLFAGAGVVGASRPADELRETQLKLRAMLQVLEEDARS
jgi:menaquinone-specific isochorismate synthase